MKTDQKNNLVANPSLSSDAGGIRDWSFQCPREELLPQSEVRIAPGRTSLVISANGDKYAVGWWQGMVKMQPGKWYKASVKARLNGIANPALSIMAQAAGHFLVPTGSWKQEVLLEQVFMYNSEAEGNKFDLMLRAAEKGSVEYFEPCVVEIPKPSFRMARIATVRFGPPAAKMSLESQRNRIVEKLNDAGTLKPDIVAFTEWCHVEGLDPVDYTPYSKVAETVPDGPACRVLSAAAKKYKMYVLAGLLESRKGKLYNTAVIFDRDGRFIGQYDKTHPTWPELEAGISCGTGYPIFDLDFGKIAVHICYDEWFPEVSRYYAHAGAEILFLPVMGGKPITWRTRALDSGIYFVSAATNPPSMIIDSSGSIIAQTHGGGVVCADINLEWRQTNVVKDPTLANGMPCLNPQLRHVIDDNMLHDLENVMKNEK